MWWLLGVLILLDQDDRISRMEARARRVQEPQLKPKRLTKKDKERMAELARFRAEHFGWPNDLMF
jgi:hypothetical protein